MSTLVDAYETGYRDGLMAAIGEVGRIQPRDAMVTVRSSHEEFTPTHRHIVEVADVHARVLPVAMGESTLLVEWDDGTLGTANLHDIRMVG